MNMISVSNLHNQIEMIRGGLKILVVQNDIQRFHKSQNWTPSESALNFFFHILISQLDFHWLLDFATILVQCRQSMCLL